MKHVYHLVAILAILHLAGLAAGVGFLWSRGTLNPERVDRIAAVLRGEYDQSGPATADMGSNGAIPVDPTAEGAAQDVLDEEMGRFKSERARAELDQQLALVTREMIRVREERDRFEDQQAREADAARKKMAQTRQAGFQKQLQYFESVKPALALELLLGREDEEAADLLKSMDTRKGRKIIEAARTPAQKKKLDSIMRLLPELNAVPVTAEPDGAPSKAVP